MQSSGRLRHSKSPLAALLFSFIYIQPDLAFGGFSWTQRGIAMIEGCNTSFTSCNLQRSRSNRSMTSHPLRIQAQQLNAMPAPAAVPTGLLVCA